MKKIFINKRVHLAGIAALICIVYLIWATYSNMHNSNAESAKIKTSLGRLLQLENLMVHVQNVESGVRGFVISGNEDFLAPYYKGLSGINRDTPYLNLTPVERNPENVKIQNLIDLINKKVNYSAGIIETRRLLGADSAIFVIQKKEGKELMDQITTIISELQNAERNKLQNSNAIRATLSNRSSKQLFMLAFLFLTIMLVSYYIINKDFNKILKAEQKLKFNASLIRNISDPIITTDIFNNITNWNEYAEQLYGYCEEEVLGKSAKEVLNIENVAMNEILNPAFENDYWKGELIHYHKDGTPIFVDVTVSSIKNDGGEKMGTVAVVRNISERKHTEQKLQRLTINLEEEVKIKAAELNIVFERITDAFIALDNQWNYTYINNKAAELHNRPIEELLGKNIWEENKFLINEPFYESLHSAKKTNLAQRLELYYSKTDQWFENLIYPSPDGISVYYHDITDKKKAEISLHQTNKKLNYHINNTPMGFVEYDMNFKIIQWSDKAKQIFGWTMEELLQQKYLLSTLVYKDDIREVKEVLLDIQKNKFSSGITQIRNITKSGKVIYCEWYNSVLKDDDGKVTGVMSMVYDITSRKQIQLNLEEAEVKFRSLVEQSMVGVYILQLDKFAYVNPRLRELFGYDNDEMVDNISILDVVHPEDREMVLTNIMQRLKGGSLSVNYEVRALKKNGEILHVEVFGSLTQYLGKPAIIGTLIDVTEKKEAELKILESQEALRKSNERFLLVAKATNDAVWDWDIVNNKIWGNEILSGFFNMPVGMSVQFDDFIRNVHPDDRRRIEENFYNSIESKQTTITETFQFKVKEKSYLTFTDRAYILYDEKGIPFRMLGAMQDITEQKRNEQQILQEKELSDSIINSLPGVFYIFKVNGPFYRWNKNLLTITGYTEDEIMKTRPEDLFADDEKELIRNKLADIFIKGEETVEAGLLSKEGKTTPYYFKGMVIQYEGDTCIMGVGIDISEKVKSQQELIQSEERYRTIIEQASDGIFISDLQGNYLDVNTNGIKLSGYSKEELLKMTVFDLMPPGGQEENPPKFDEIFAGKVALNERKFSAKDGSIKEVEISAKLLSGGRFIGMVRDITARNKTREALRASEEKYRLLFNQNPMPMWMISLPDRKFLDVNQAAIEFYGYAKHEFLEMTVYDIRPDDEVDKLKKYNEVEKLDGVVYAGVWSHKKKDGTLIKVNIISHNIFYEGKNAKLILANDVTQKIMAEEALQKSHEELRQLATHLEKVRETERTHIAREIHDELGQQLTGLKMDISWLNRKLKNQEADVHQKITETIQLVDATVKTVRRISTELRPSILDDLGLVAALEWQSEEFEKRSEISCKFSSNVAEVKVHPDIATGVFRIYQESLTNVLRHAEATAVTSFLELESNTIKLSISDNGIGFIENEIANKKTLGLLGMKERTNLLGGTYEITSIPEKGTSVQIIVPLKNI